LGWLRGIDFEESEEGTMGTIQEVEIRNRLDAILQEARTQTEWLTRIAKALEPAGTEEESEEASTPR
jgi:hypothetical protein